MSLSTKQPPAVAVYCASSIGSQKAYQLAALSLGKTLASSSRPLVYGGGSKGIMGIISGAVLEGGGEVTGVVPWAMIKAGGEGDKGVGVEKVEARGRLYTLCLMRRGGRRSIRSLSTRCMNGKLKWLNA